MYRYLIVPKDLSVEQQIIQAAHASCCAVPSKDEASVSICLLEVNTKSDLSLVKLLLTASKIKVTSFTDSAYHGSEFTSLITEPLDGNDPRRALFSKYNLYSHT